MTLQEVVCRETTAEVNVTLGPGFPVSYSSLPLSSRSTTTGPPRLTSTSSSFGINRGRRKFPSPTTSLPWYRGEVGSRVWTTPGDPRSHPNRGPRPGLRFRPVETSPPTHPRTKGRSTPRRSLLHSGVVSVRVSLPSDDTDHLLTDRLDPPSDGMFQCL